VCDNGTPIGGLAVVLINTAWAGIFVLLPLEIATMKAWNRATEKS